MVDEKEDYADGYGGVGDVEDGVEEFEVFAADEGHPLRPMEGEEWEVEHVDDFAAEEGSIAAFGREECGDGVVALVEYEAVEAAVDKVSDSAGEDECKADNECCAGAFTGTVEYEPDYGCGSDDAQQGEDDLACSVADAHAEGEADVFDEVETAPGADEGDFLTDLHVGFDPEFEDLVGDEDCGEDDGREPDLFFTVVHCDCFTLALAIGFWLLVFGYWLLAFGRWLSAANG